MVQDLSRKGRSREHSREIRKTWKKVVHTKTLYHEKRQFATVRQSVAPRKLAGQDVWLRKAQNLELKS